MSDLGMVGTSKENLSLFVQAGLTLALVTTMFQESKQNRFVTSAMRLAVLCRAAGDPSCVKSYLPPTQQFLITRGGKSFPGCFSQGLNRAAVLHRPHAYTFEATHKQN